MKVESAYFKKEFDVNKAELVGEGNFAQVYRIFDPEIQDSLAIRKVDKNHAETQDIQKERIINEELKKVKNENILQIYDIIDSPTAVWYITEFCEGGSLWDALNQAKDNKMPEKDGLECVLQISKGVQELHNHRITHRDLKPQNILLKTKYIPGRPLPTIKIADFGLSTKKIIMETVAGTKQYIAPEQAKFHNYTNAVDVWSLGIICDEILHGNPFYMGDNNKEVFQKIVKNPFQVRDQCLRPSIKEFLISLLKKKPYERPIIAVIRQTIEKILEQIEEESMKKDKDKINQRNKQIEKKTDFFKKDNQRKVILKENDRKGIQNEEKKQMNCQDLEFQSSASSSRPDIVLKKRKNQSKLLKNEIPHSQVKKTPLKRIQNGPKIEINTEQQQFHEQPPYRSGRVPVRIQTHPKSGGRTPKSQSNEKKQTNSEQSSIKKQPISNNRTVQHSQGKGNEKITIHKVDKKKLLPQYTVKKEPPIKAITSIDTKDYVKEVARMKDQVGNTTLQLKKNHEFIPNPQLNVNQMPEKLDTEQILKEFRQKYDHLNYLNVNDEYEIKLANGHQQMHKNAQKTKKQLEQYRNSIKQSFFSQIDKYIDHFVDKNIS